MAPLMEDFSVKSPETSIPDQAAHMESHLPVPLVNGKMDSHKDDVHVNGKTIDHTDIINVQPRSNSMPVSFHSQSPSSSGEYPTPPATPFPPFETHFVAEVPPTFPKNLKVPPHTLPVPKDTNAKRPRGYSTSKPFTRISRPVELLRNEYDVVVIGSGYGGAVAASRFSRAGESVCLLERGREKWRKSSLLLFKYLLNNC